MKQPTERQTEVLSFISEYINVHSYPPAIREIADHFGMSVKGAYDHITALKRKGYLKQDGKRPRTMELVKSKEQEGMAALTEIPILGTVAAGVPILSEENWDGTITLHRSMLKKNKKYFALNVRGDSMIGAGIMDGDIAVIEKQSIVRNGEIAVAVVDEAVTLKRFYKESSRVRLQSENPAYKPIYSRDVRVLGRLARIVRSY
ncbi:MAG: transcriptional repressor LexA [Treponema sp.]|jgi:repressor LexA|nr:transcriptional repressor LexA [Treponema sp.]